MLSTKLEAVSRGVLYPRRTRDKPLIATVLMYPRLATSNAFHELSVKKSNSSKSIRLPASLVLHKDLLVHVCSFFSDSVLLDQADEKDFSGFVFKIHANMDPKHRDRLAFVKIVSGTFERNTPYLHVRQGKKLKFSSPNAFFAEKKKRGSRTREPKIRLALLDHDSIALAAARKNVPNASYLLPPPAT